MATIEQSILLSAVGGDGAAAQVGMVNKSLQDVEGTHDALKQRFGERFQHIGLQLFAGEALRASGVGMETRGVINVLNMAMTTMGGAMGGAVGPILMVVSALAAVGGIIAKVVEHHKNLAEQLEKTNKATDEQLKKTVETITSIETYTKEIGTVPAFLKRWEDSEKSLQAAQVARQISGDRAQVASLTALMNQENRRQEQMKGEIADQEKLIDSLKRMQVDMATVATASAQLDILKKRFNDGKISAAEHKAKIDELIADIHLLGTNGTDDLGKLAEAHKKAAEEAKKAAEEAKKISDKEAEEETARYQHWAELHAKTIITKTELDNQYAKDFKATEMSAFKDTAQVAADAFVQMGLHGKSFVDAMTTGFQQMAEKIIADIIRIKLEWLILSAMMPGSMLGAGGGMSVFGMAEGGSVLVDRPTMFLAGEAGQPEVATFTPLSKLGGGGSTGGSMAGSGNGGGVNIGTIQINAYEATDADELGRKLIERIRGMGELNFTRLS